MNLDELRSLYMEAKRRHKVRYEDWREHAEKVSRVAPLIENLQARVLEKHAQGEAIDPLEFVVAVCGLDLLKAIRDGKLESLVDAGRLLDDIGCELERRLRPSAQP